jgi:hypothetical protein
MRMAFELIPEIGDEQARESIMRLQRGEISDLVRLADGWAFFRAEETARPADFDDPSQMDKIRGYIMGNLRGQAEDWLFVEARNFTAQARETGFVQAAADRNILTQNFGPIPVNYGNSLLFANLSSTGIPELAAATTNQFFWRAAFSTPLNSPSEPLVIGDNVIVLFPLEENEADEYETQMIEGYYLGEWMGRTSEQAYRSHFLNNEKFDDRFNDMFWKIWAPLF